MFLKYFQNKFVKLIAWFLVGVMSTSLFIHFPTPPTLAQNPQSCAAVPVKLNPDEEKIARAAWQYFINNYQQETGFANSANGYPSGTLWDMGNYLMALNAARWLNFIEQQEFDSRLNKFLEAMSGLKLFEDSLPNKVYNAANGALVDYGNNPLERGIGWSALDIGRILAAFHVLRACHPQYNDWLKSVLDRWAIERSLKDNKLYGAAVLENGETLLVQEGRLGYEEYAARGYELWGFKAPEALSFEPFKFVDIYGVQIPVDTREFQTTNANNYVVTESYVLDGLEFGFKGDIAEYAARILEVQKRRYEQTGQLTAVSEDNINQPPYFIYNTVYANGVPWAAITEKNEAHPDKRTISCKAAFGLYFLYPNSEYARKLFNQTKDPCYTPDGIMAGIYEQDNKPNDVLTGNTNGLVMEMIYYKARGNQPLIGYDLVSASTGKPVGEDYTAPVFTAGNQTPAPTQQPPASQSSQSTQQPPSTQAATSCPATPVPCPGTVVDASQVNIAAIAGVGNIGASNCCKLIRSLTVAERRYAEAAWEYFEANFETNTGLVNDRADFKGITLWGVGDYLAALHAAHCLKSHLYREVSKFASKYSQAASA